MNYGNALGGILGTFLLLETLNSGVEGIEKSLDTPSGDLE